MTHHSDTAHLHLLYRDIKPHLWFLKCSQKCGFFWLVITKHNQVPSTHFIILTQPFPSIISNPDYDFQFAMVVFESLTDGDIEFWFTSRTNVLKLFLLLVKAREWSEYMLWNQPEHLLISMMSVMLTCNNRQKCFVNEATFLSTIRLSFMRCVFILLWYFFLWTPVNSVK